MNINNTIEDFSKGQRVNVEPMPNDVFSEPFTGIITGFKPGAFGEGSLIQVQDMDGDTGDVCPDQCQYNSDDIMHCDSCGHL